MMETCHSFRRSALCLVVGSKLSTDFMRIGLVNFNGTGRPLASAQMGRILQSLGLSGKLLGSNQAWVAA